MPHLSADEFEALGLYDPGAANAGEQLELLEYLVGLGASDEDLLDHRNELPGLATVLVVRGGPALTAAQAAERVGVPLEKLLRVMRAAGFPEPGPDDRVVSEQFAGLVPGMAAAEVAFGQEAVLQFVRVMGSAMARLASAMVSMFLVNIEPRAREEEHSSVALARANAEAAGLIPAANLGLDILLRQHVIAARRTTFGDPSEAGFETQLLSVGFIDLVGSTALAQRLSIGELGALLTTFEHVVTDSVTSQGGRVVKLIGDAVLFTANDEASACAIALELTGALEDHPIIPQVHTGIASGAVLLRDGDVFGPVVNLAARAAKAAGPGEVVAPGLVAMAAGVAAEPLGPQELKGIVENAGLCRLSSSLIP